jgi:hypothetical protein
MLESVLSPQGSEVSMFLSSQYSSILLLKEQPFFWWISPGSFQTCCFGRPPDVMDFLPIPNSLDYSHIILLFLSPSLPLEAHGECWHTLKDSNAEMEWRFKERRKGSMKPLAPKIGQSSYISLSHQFWCLEPIKY